MLFLFVQGARLVKSYVHHVPYGTLERKNWESNSEMVTKTTVGDIVKRRKLSRQSYRSDRKYYHVGKALLPVVSQEMDSVMKTPLRVDKAVVLKLLRKRFLRSWFNIVSCITVSGVVLNARDRNQYRKSIMKFTDESRRTDNVFVSNATWS